MLFAKFHSSYWELLENIVYEIFSNKGNGKCFKRQVGVSPNVCKDNWGYGNGCLLIWSSINILSIYQKQKALKLLNLSAFVTFWTIYPWPNLNLNQWSKQLIIKQIINIKINRSRYSPSLSLIINSLRYKYTLNLLKLHQFIT